MNTYQGGRKQARKKSLGHVCVKEKKIVPIHAF